MPTVHDQVRPAGEVALESGQEVRRFESPFISSQIIEA